jgi:hypothetical protein
MNHYHKSFIPHLLVGDPSIVRDAPMADASFTLGPLAPVLGGSQAWRLNVRRLGVRRLRDMQ